MQLLILVLFLASPYVISNYAAFFFLAPLLSLVYSGKKYGLGFIAFAFAAAGLVALLPIIKYNPLIYILATIIIFLFMCAFFAISVFLIKYLENSFLTVLVPCVVWACLLHIFNVKSLLSSMFDVGVLVPMSAPIIWYIGASGITTLLILFNSALAKFIAKKDRVALALAAAIALAFIASFIFSANAIQGYPQKTENGVKVALIQGGVETRTLLGFKDNIDRRIKRYVDLSAGVDKYADIVIWPEYAFPLDIISRYPAKVAPVFDEIKRSGHTFVIGSIRNDPLKNDVHYDSALVIGGDGNIRDTYYSSMPFVFSRHVSAQKFENKTYIDKAGIVLCWEEFSPKIFRFYVKAGAEYFITMLNDIDLDSSWFKNYVTFFPRARAAESMRYIARVTQTGLTEIIGPFGNVVKSIPTDRPGALTAEIYRIQGKTFYSVHGDVINRAFVITVLIMFLLAGTRRRKVSESSRLGRNYSSRLDEILSFERSREDKISSRSKQAYTLPNKHNFVLARTILLNFIQKIKIPSRSKNKKSLFFKSLCLVLTVTFIFNQVAFAADTFSYQYKYSAAKALLPNNSQKDQNNMAPSYLLTAQAQHEAIIDQKNMVETEPVYKVDTQAPRQDESITLQKKQSSTNSGSGKRQIAYALTDYDANGKAQQIFVYTYGGAGGALSKVVSYDLRDFKDIPWASSNLEKVSAEGEDLVMGSFTQGDYTSLTDKLKVKTVSYFGSPGQEKVDYILSDYVDGKPGEASLYKYDPVTTALSEVDTYDISLLDIDFEHATDDSWKDGVRTGSSLTKKAIYEGSSGAEQLAYVLSEYDSSGAAGRLDCYDYSGTDSPITQVRAYNLKGINLQSNLEDMRMNLSSSDQYLISKTNYKGKKDHEQVDNVLSSYYLDTNDNTYKPARESGYTYDDTGRLNKTDTYNIKNGVRILKYSSEFTGLKGHEVISRSSEYDIDGVTVISISVYEYENRILNKVTKYAGPEVADDKVKTVTFYSGTEGKELVSYVLEYDITSGVEVSRTDYTYDNGALRLTETHRGGSLVSSVTYTGLKGSEKASSSTSFDLSGNILSTSAYQYNSNGSLETISTFSPDGKKISQTRYAGSEGNEEIGTATNFDLTGNILTLSYYVYGNSGNIESVTTYDSNGVKSSSTIYRGAQNNERVSSVTSYDLDGNTLSQTTYNYNAGLALTTTVTTDSNGLVLSQSSYSGPANYEKISSVTNFDRLHNALTITDYSYNASGALTKSITTDVNGVELSESDYTGLTGYERVTGVTSFDKLHNILTTTSYAYNTSGALESTTTTDVVDNDISGSRHLNVGYNVSTYSGLSGHEKVTSVTSFDKLHSALTTTSYTYASSGAINSTVTTDAAGIILSEAVYSGLSGQEKIASATSYDKLHNALTTTSYIYDASGALSSTVTSDVAGVILSESSYSGLSGAEKIISASSFDKLHNLLTQTSYSYNASGALESTETDAVDGSSRHLNVGYNITTYSGLQGQEKVASTTSFDKLHNTLTVTSYLYNNSGALSSTVTKDASGVILSESAYSGLMNQEKVTSATSFDKLHNMLTITSYLYNTTGALASTVTQDSLGLILSESVYSGSAGQEKVTSSTSFDKLHNALTTTNYTYGASGALESTQTDAVDSSSRHLNVGYNITTYSGLSGQEKVVSASSFDKGHTLLTRTNYIYDASGALTQTVTADVVDNDISGSRHLNVGYNITTYSGLSGQEKITSASSFDKQHNLLTTTNYSYDASGALESTQTDAVDSSSRHLNVGYYITTYSGLSGQEKITSATSFDKLHNAFTTTNYVYDASGALTETITKDAGGIVLSESIYAGFEGQEKVTSVTSFDNLYNALTITSYLYNNTGALTSTVTKDSSGAILSESTYSGLANQEKVISVSSFDKLYNKISTTSYTYDVSGALESTETDAVDGSSRHLNVGYNITTYSGLSGQEKVSTATSFDKLYNILTTTSYLYSDTGALTSTVTKDASGVILSESTYSGPAGREKVISATSFDKLQNILTTTSYVYNASGALESTETDAVDSSSRHLNVGYNITIYSGLSGQEKIASATSFDKLHNALATTSYLYNNSGALSSTVTKDAGGVILSESVYSGPLGAEKVTSASSFDKLHNLLTTTNYSYDNSGALASTVTKDAGGVILSESVYSGLSNAEKVTSVSSFDKQHNLLTSTSYSYNDTGALASTVTKDAGGITLSESIYLGSVGQEKVTSATSFDKLHNALITTDYLYNNAGALAQTVTADVVDNDISGSRHLNVGYNITIYSGLAGQEKVISATSFDKLHSALTVTNYTYNASGALASTETDVVDSSSRHLNVGYNITTYSGLSGQEKVSSATSYDKLQNILTTTSYLYDVSGALANTVTTDAGGIIISEAYYSGLQNQEKISSAVSFDKLANQLSTTNYVYDNTGALTNTVTVDAAGIILSEASYTGSQNQEKVSSIISFDKLHDVLSTTSYLYNNAGALAQTVTADVVDNDISGSRHLNVGYNITIYSGLAGQEKVTSSASFDKLHNALTTTSYLYNNSGALSSTVTKDASGVILSESIYSGSMNQEKVTAATSFDKLHNALTTTNYVYDASGALTQTVTTDVVDNDISGSRHLNVGYNSTTYTGLLGQEKVTSASSFDKLHNLLTTTNYIYNNSGALASTVTKDSSGVTLSESAYAGLTGQEKVQSATSFDKLYNALSTTSYLYDASGALSNTVTTDIVDNDISGSRHLNVGYNITTYTGLVGQEKVTGATSYDKLANPLATTSYIYNTSGALESTITTDAPDDSSAPLRVRYSISIYSGLSGQEKIVSSTSFDKLNNILTATSYIYSNSGALMTAVTKDTSGIILSESIYSGLQGQEKVALATSFDKLHNTLTTTNYVYNLSGALESATTDAVDSSSRHLNVGYNITTYTGLRVNAFFS